jgi:hypothetical protein
MSNTSLFLRLRHILLVKSQCLVSWTNFIDRNMNIYNSKKISIDRIGHLVEDLCLLLSLDCIVSFTKILGCRTPLVMS